MTEIVHPPYDRLVAYAVDELSLEAAAVTRAHLAVCLDCRARVRRLRQLRSLMRRKDLHTPPLATLARAKAIFKQQAYARPARIGRLEALARVMGVLPVRFALALLVLLLTCSVGTAYAMADLSRQALPGDALYPVKRALEDLQVAITLSDSGKTRLQMTLAEARAQEILALAADGRYEHIPLAASAFESQVAATANSLKAIIERDPRLGIPLAEQMERDLEGATQLLATLQADGPDGVKPIIAQAIAVSQAGQSLVMAQIPPSTVVPLGGVASATPVQLNEPALPTATPTWTARPTQTLAPTYTKSPLPVPTEPSPTATLTPTALPTFTASPSPTQSHTATASPSPTPEPTNTPLPSDTPRPTETLEPTSTLEPTNTPLPSDTPRPTETPEPTNTPLPSDTPEPSPTTLPRDTAVPTEEPPIEPGRQTRTPWFFRTPRPTRTPEPDTIDPGGTPIELTSTALPTASD